MWRNTQKKITKRIRFLIAFKLKLSQLYYILDLLYITCRRAGLINSSLLLVRVSQSSSKLLKASKACIISALKEHLCECFVLFLFSFLFLHMVEAVYCLKLRGLIFFLKSATLGFTRRYYLHFLRKCHFGVNSTAGFFNIITCLSF